MALDGFSAFEDMVRNPRWTRPRFEALRRNPAMLELLEMFLQIQIVPRGFQAYAFWPAMVEDYKIHDVYADDGYVDDSEHSWTDSETDSETSSSDNSSEDEDEDLDLIELRQGYVFFKGKVLMHTKIPSSTAQGLANEGAFTGFRHHKMRFEPFSPYNRRPCTATIRFPEMGLTRLWTREIPEIRGTETVPGLKKLSVFD